MKGTYDIAVVGSGFAGSLMAMIARRLGRSVVLMEKGKHPRVVIGESSTPLSNLLLEELAVRYDLPGVRPFAKYGTWRETYPEVACGLKRGFTFYHHDLAHPRPDLPGRDRQLLVAASPEDRVADTHWYRADVDAALVEQARECGAEYFDECDLRGATVSADGVRIEGVRRGEAFCVDARFVIDATGPRGFLHRALGLTEGQLPSFPQTEAVYSHFAGVGRLDADAVQGGGETAPYPIDDAAVHHVFDGGWAWVLQFSNGLTSAGFAATGDAAEALRPREGAAAWSRLLERVPVLARQFRGARAVQPFRWIPQLAFRSEEVVGERWALLPSAAGFVDPLLSSGFPLTLLGIARMAEILERDWETERFGQGLRTYAVRTDGELLATARLVGGLYWNMGNFPVFASLTLLYFAAASFSETARRLGKPELAGSFLLHEDPVFGPECARLLGRAARLGDSLEAEELRQEIVRAIEPFNTGGFGDERRRNWYPVDFDDLMRAGSKVHAREQDIVEMLQGCGVWLEPAVF